MNREQDPAAARSSRPRALRDYAQAATSDTAATRARFRAAAALLACVALAACGVDGPPVAPRNFGPSPGQTVEPAELQGASPGFGVGGRASAYVQSGP